LKTKLDLTTLLGLIISLGGLGTGYFLEGGSFIALLAVSPLIIIFAGTIGVVTITQTGNGLKQLPGIFKAIFLERTYNYIEIIDNLCKWAKTTRNSGIVALDTIKNEIEDPFIRRGLDLVAASIEPEHVEVFLDTEIESMQSRHSNNANIFEQAGGFSPTMGIIGTVLGLIVILAKLGDSDIGELGHGIATAFLATLMGVGFANLICLPFAAKLKNRSKQETLYREIAKQGILAIQSQESPLVLRKRLLSMLPDYLKTGKETKNG
jgi:chemotaxis protein MotA